MMTHRAHLDRDNAITAAVLCGRPVVLVAEQFGLQPIRIREITCKRCLEANRELYFALNGELKGLRAQRDAFVTALGEGGA